MKDKFRIISIVFYLLIILKGDIIGLPFFLWLLFTVFDFGNIVHIPEVIVPLIPVIQCHSFR
jgi:hypothetical protein